MSLMLNREVKKMNFRAAPERTKDSRATAQKIGSRYDSNPTNRS